MTNKNKVDYLLLFTFIWLGFLCAFFNTDILLSHSDGLYNDIAGIVREYDSTNSILITGEEDKYYSSLKEAIASVTGSENVVLKLQKDIRINEIINIPAGKNITIDGDNKYSILYGLVGSNYYTGRFFDIKAGATLNLNNLIFNGENEWTFNQELYDESLNNHTAINDIYTVIGSEENAPIMRTTLFNNSGLLNVNNSEFKNYYSNNGSYFFNGNKNSTINISGCKIFNNASSGTIVSYISGANSYLNVNDNTLIDNNFVAGNGGIFKTYTGGVTTFNSGVVSNTRAINCNGVVSMTYGAGSTFCMNGGTITKNIGISGVSNGRNAPIYIHSGSLFIMNGGVIEENRGGSCGGVDAPGHDTSNLQLNGGVIKNNKTVTGYEYRSDLNVQNDYDLVIGKDMVIEGNITVSGDVTNEGVITGDISLKLESKGEDLNTLNGDGVLNGNLIVFHAENAVPVTPNSNINGSHVNCDVSYQVVVTFNYNGGIDEKNLGYRLVPVDSSNVVTDVPVTTKVGYTFNGWYVDKELTIKWDETSAKNYDKLYAGWTINKHTVTWLVDGVRNDVIYTYGDVIEEYPTPSKANYHFGGWANYNSGMTLPDYNLVFEAKWSPVLYNVVFDSNGGSLVNSVPVYYGNKVARPVDPVYQCKTLAGWYYDKTFTKEFDFNSNISGNTVLYAKWDENHVWSNWVWYNNEKHVRECATDHTHLSFEEHTIDETGYCSVCRNYDYSVYQVEEDTDIENESMIFMVHGDKTKFLNIKINDEIIDSKYYTITSKQEIILDPVFVKKMSDGEQELKVVFSDGESSCQFRIEHPKVEKKFNYLFILLIILLIIICIIIYRKYKKHKKNKLK